MPEDGGMRVTESELDFTHRARRSLREAIADPYFRDSDPDVIYETLREKLRAVPFGDYLKRYLYRRAHWTGQYTEIPEAAYQSLLVGEFTKRNTPCSFTPTTARLKNLTKNWLEQKVVSRQVVLLLGFGLGMSENDVDAFLAKVLKEQRLNAKDPFEVICWYCYRQGLPYARFEALWTAYRNGGARREIAVPDLDTTVRFKQRMLTIRNEAELGRYLAELPVAQGERRQSVAARRAFDRLYEQARELAARSRTEMERDDAARRAGRLMDRLSRSDRLYDYQKQAMIEKERHNFHVFRKEEIGAADIEQFVFSAIPRDSHGNLLPMKASSLNEQFAGKRLNRQHMGEILSGRAPVTRYDLLTMYFFVFGQSREARGSRKERYATFIERANRILRASDMGPVYLTNPYESFLLMCVLSDDPLGTYADVWERSYEG